LGYPEDSGRGLDEEQEEGGLKTSPMTSPQRKNSKSQQVATSGRESGYLRPLHAPKAPPAQGPNGRHTRPRSGASGATNQYEGVGEQQQQQEEFGKEHYTDDDHDDHDGNVVEGGEEFQQGMGFAATSGSPLISLTSPTNNNHLRGGGGGGGGERSHASYKEAEDFLNLDLDSPTAVMQRASISGQQGSDGGGLLHPGEPSSSVANDSLGGSLEVESWGGKK